MSTAVAILVSQTHELYQDIHDTVAAAVAGSARNTRGLVEGNRGHIEATANAIFSSLISFHFSGQHHGELQTHLIRQFPTALASNEAALIARRYSTHLSTPAQEVLAQAVGNGSALMMSIDLIKRDPQAFGKTYGLTWLATQPFRWASHTTVDELVGFLRAIERAAAHHRSRR